MGNDHLEDLGFDGMTTLEFIFHKQFVKMWYALKWLSVSHIIN